MNETATIFILMIVFAIFSFDTVFDIGIIPNELQVINDKEPISFKEVKPIFESRCTKCHSNKVWNWSDYDVAKRNKDKIRFRVWSLKNMPPNSMPFDERVKIKDWIDGGANP